MTTAAHLEPLRMTDHHALADRIVARLAAEGYAAGTWAKGVHVLVYVTEPRSRRELGHIAITLDGEIDCDAITARRDHIESLVGGADDDEEWLAKGGVGTYKGAIE